MNLLRINHLEHSKRTLLSLGIAQVALLTAARGDVLYSVDYTTDQLVLIDSQVGTVVVVGSLGTDVFDVDLAVLNGQLFAADSHDAYTNPYCDLLVIDRASGAVTHSVRATLNGSNVYAEGLATVGGQLWIAFDPAPTGYSHEIGVVDPATGVINNALSYLSFSADMDGLGADPSGMLHAVDATPAQLQSSRVYRVGLNPQSYTLFAGPYGSPSDPLGMNDVVLTMSDAYAIENYSRRILRLDPSTGALTHAANLNPSLALLGLEFACSSPFVYGTAKTNSLGCVPAIASSGIASAGLASSFTVSCANVVNNKNGLLFYGFAQASVPFQGGFKLVASPNVRTPVQGSGGNAPPADDCSGNLAFDFNAHIQGGSDPNLVPGAQVYCQYWYRDPASGSTTGLSDAVCFSICY